MSIVATFFLVQSLISNHTKVKEKIARACTSWNTWNWK